MEGGFLVLYNKLIIKRLIDNPRKQFTQADYRQLQNFYKTKIEQIHIVGTYAQRMIKDYKEGLNFVEDYFQLAYKEFLKKYFPGNKKAVLSNKITTKKFKQLFGDLSPRQLKIIKDNKSKYTVIPAGPGSGKTRVLVRKLAALLLMGEVKYEQLLMVTFSRAAATEFKQRLLHLIGKAAHYVDIKTFHSFCFDVVGQRGSIEQSSHIIKMALTKIAKGEVLGQPVTKTIMVIDEAQDLDENEFNLIKTMMKHNKGMRIIAVGDDDQNIYGFRGADSKYMKKILKAKQTKKYEMTRNYRSKKNIVALTNQFIDQLQGRLKTTPITAQQKDMGEIKIVRYQSSYLLSPLVHDLLTTNFSGTTAVLTQTNKQALKLNGLLRRQGHQARLIQAQIGFNLYNMNEVRYFLSILTKADNNPSIDNHSWEKAKRQINQIFKDDEHLPIVNKLINDFEETHKQKYLSDLEIFIKESSYEDFVAPKEDIISVSTIHKAKGKEFDNVFLLLKNPRVEKDEVKRKIYVAMTRAKNLLHIHTNSGFLKEFEPKGLDYKEDNSSYQPPKELTLQLGHKDVILSFFNSGNRQYLITRLKIGEPLFLHHDYLTTAKKEPILKLSNQFKAQIRTLVGGNISQEEYQQQQTPSSWNIVKASSYQFESAKVNFIVYWQPAEQEKDICIVLPTLILRRS